LLSEIDKARTPAPKPENKNEDPGENFEQLSLF
jgi:hypothetical protein